MNDIPVEGLLIVSSFRFEEYRSVFWRLQCFSCPLLVEFLNKHQVKHTDTEPLRDDTSKSLEVTKGCRSHTSDVTHYNHSRTRLCLGTIIFHFLPLVGSAGPTVEMGSRTISSNRHGDMRYAETDAFDFIERNAGELCALCDATSCVTHFRLFPPHDFALQPWGGCPRYRLCVIACA